MNLTLQRTQIDSTGCYGILKAEDVSFLAVTLEHAYNNGQGSYTPKIPANTYTCIVGEHQLAGASGPEELYELQDVPNHTNILIHAGNWENNSSGCILVGQSKQGNMITNSRATLEKIMKLQNEEPFELTVLDPQDNANLSQDSTPLWLSALLQFIKSFMS